MKIDDRLSEVFDIIPQPVTEVIDNTTGEIIKTPEGKIENDYDTARDNLRELLITGQNALMHALEVAKQSEHPRAFEVVGNLMKQVADMNDKLIDLQQKMKNLNKEDKKSMPTTVNNTMFIGTTADLQKMIKDAAKNK